MKNRWKYLLIFLAVTSVLFTWQCNPKPVDPSITRYSYLDPIVDPPDTFQVLYNVSTFGDKPANITFQDSAVWKISLMGDGRVLFGVIDPNDSSWNSISANDTIGFQGNVSYTFVATNNNVDDLSTYYVQFTKLPINYSGFPRKF